MRKIVIVVAMMLFASMASAEMIGLYADEAATVCYATIMPGEPVPTYIIATLTQLADVGIVAAEFKIDNLPPNGYAFGGMVTVYPTSDVVIGDLYTDFSIAWPTPQGAGTGYVLIARVEFLSFDPAWVGADQLMQVVEGETCNCLVVVDDVFVSYDAIGGSFWGNCTNPEDCQCIEDTATQDASWGSVKALF